MQTSSAMNIRKRNNRYVANHHNYKKRKQFVLEPGMTGFLCTCNFHERGCITDAYKLLNLFADENSASDINEVLDKHRHREKCTRYLVYYKYTYFYYFKKSETSNTANTLDEKEDDKSLENTDDDISTALEKEINELRTEREMPLPSRKFQVHLCHNCWGLILYCIMKLFPLRYHLLLSITFFSIGSGYRC